MSEISLIDIGASVTCYVRIKTFDKMQNKLPDNRPKLMSNTMPGKMSIECQGRYELPENMPGKM